MHIFFNTFMFFLEHRGIHPSLGPEVSTCPCPCVSSVSPRAFWTGVSRWGVCFSPEKTPGSLTNLTKGNGVLVLCSLNVGSPKYCSCVSFSNQVVGFPFFKNWESHLKEQWFYLVPRSSDRCWIFFCKPVQYTQHPHFFSTSLTQNYVMFHPDRGFKYVFICTPTWGNDPILTSIFFRWDWFNHQLGIYWPIWQETNPRPRCVSTIDYHTCKDFEKNPQPSKSRRKRAWGLEHATYLSKWWFQRFLEFTPLFGEDSHFD